MKQTPYQRLLNAVQMYVHKVRYPKRVLVWRYSLDNLRSKTAFLLDDLYERTAAADSLGYDVKLYATDKGLEVNYVKRPDDIDYYIG